MTTPLGGHRRRTLADINDLDLLDTAEALDLDLTADRRHLASCPACGAVGHGSAKVFPGRDGTDRWKCHRCDESGNVADLVALALFDARWDELDVDQQDKVVAVVEEQTAVAAPARSAPPVPSTPPTLVEALWRRCEPVSSDTATRDWLVRDRGLDAAQLEAMDLCRALPTATRLPRWAATWRANHRCIVPAYGHDGQRVTLRARRLDAGKPKVLAPAGPLPPGGAVMANPRGLEMLRDDAKPEVLVVVEGEPDFLTAALTWPKAPILGIWTGSWSSESGRAIPAGTHVILMTHADRSGDELARVIASSGAGRWRALRVRHEDDLNDRHRAGGLPSDPLDGAAPFELARPPRPLRPRVKLPRFPVTALPEPLASFVGSLATSTQTPPDLAAWLALSTLSLTLLHKVVVEVTPGWTVHPTLYTAVAMPPSSTKSPVFRAVRKPLEQFEDDAHDGYVVAKRTHDLEVGRLKATIKEAERARHRATDPEAAALAEEELIAAHEAMTTKVEPRLRRLTANDVTPEALAKLLAEQDERMGVFDDEGGIFQLLAGRYSGRVPNIDLVKKAWDGGRHTVDRKKADPILLHEPLLAIGLAVQPSVVHEVVGNDHFRSTGLVARFCFAMPQSLVGTRDMEPDPMPSHVANAYRGMVSKLLALPDDRDHRGRLQARIVPLTAKARRHFTKLREWIEPRMGPTGDLSTLADWAGKLPSHVAALALILHAVACIEHGDPRSSPVSADSMRRAVVLARYLIPHARVSLWGRDHRYQLAKAILGWLSRTRTDAFTESEVRDQLRSMLKGRNGASLTAALVELERHGYIERVCRRPRKKGPGRKASPSWAVSPGWDWTVP